MLLFWPRSTRWRARSALAEQGNRQFHAHAVAACAIEQRNLAAESFDGVWDNPRFTAEDGGFAEW